MQIHISSWDDNKMVETRSQTQNTLQTAWGGLVLCLWPVETPGVKRGANTKPVAGHQPISSNLYVDKMTFMLCIFKHRLDKWDDYFSNHAYSTGAEAL